MKFDKSQSPAERLKLLRVAKKLTQEDLAAKVGVKQKAYWNWESGTYEPIDYYKRQLSEALGVEPKDIWG